ncbi:MAG: single-stranded DNA-binding protein [Anaerolineae bacterium]|nr:single-stranded DNA-binding protein [Anaerolineae bacterium]
MFNQITLVGTVYKDAELRYIPTGTAVTDFIMTVTERWEGEDGGANERSVRFRVTAWGGLAEDNAPYLVAGRRLLIVGAFEEPRAWMDEMGDAHALMEVRAQRIVPVGDEAENNEFQRVVIVGNLGRDPELRYTPDGTAVTDFSMATNEVWSDRESGERQERTVWFRVTVWRRQAETVSQYLAKGRQALVTGRMENASAYIGRGGEARGSLEVTATRIRFIGGRGDAVAGGTGANVPAVYNGPAAEDDDEIPF